MCQTKHYGEPSVRHFHLTHSMGMEMNVGVCAYQYCLRLLDWAFCLCLYTSTRIIGRRSRAPMQAAMVAAKASGTEPGEATERL